METGRKNGILAEIFLKDESQTSESFVACGVRVDEKDFFEREKSKLVAAFQASTIDDDIYVICHRDELM